MLEATLLENVPKDQAVCTQEAFGPVAVLSRFTDFREALAQVNDSEFGLQAGIFTRDLYKAHLAWDTLDVGGVVVVVRWDFEGRSDQVAPIRHDHGVGDRFSGSYRLTSCRHTVR